MESEIPNKAKYLEILELCNTAEVEEELLATEKNVELTYYFSGSLIFFIIN